MSSYKQLTVAQIDEIRQTALDQYFEACQQDDSFLVSVLTDRMADWNTAELLEAISGDPDDYPHLLSFDPETGTPWDFCEECNEAIVEGECCCPDGPVSTKKE